MTLLSEKNTSIDSFAEVNEIKFDSEKTFNTEKVWIMPTLEKTLRYKVLVGRTDLFGSDDKFDPDNPAEYDPVEMRETLVSDPEISQSPHQKEILERYDTVQSRGSPGMNVINPHTAAKVTTIISSIHELLSLEHGEFANTTWGEGVSDNMRTTIIGLIEHVQDAKQNRTPMHMENIEMAYDLAELVYNKLSPETEAE